MKTKIFLTVFLMLLTTGLFAQRGYWNWGNTNVKTMSGTITDSQRPYGSFKSNDGTEYVLHFGPIWYWNKNNFEISNGSATIKGNVTESNGKYDLYPFEISQNGKNMVFTDDNGVPKWSGNGKGWRNGRGYCRQYQNDNGNTGWGRNRGNCPNPNCPWKNK